jgi:hypothetical protein
MSALDDSRAAIDRTSGGVRKVLRQNCKTSKKKTKKQNKNKTKIFFFKKKKKNFFISNTNKTKQIAKK